MARQPLPPTLARTCRHPSLTMPPKKRRAKGKKSKRRAAPRVQVARICSAGLSRLLVKPGESESALRITLGEAVKRLWAFAKARGLQEGQTIRCNDDMHRLFGASKLGMFQVSGKLSEHMRGAGSSSAAAAPAPPAPIIPLPQPILKLSPALTLLLSGAREPELRLTRTDALRRVGGYITRQGLRDESDKRKIHCDAALGAIVGRTSFTIFEAKSLLERHFTPIDAGSGGSAAAANEDDDDDEDDEDDDEDDEEDSEEGSEVDDDGAAAEGDNDAEAMAAAGDATSSIAAPASAEAPPPPGAAQSAADADTAGQGERRAAKRKRVPPSEFICPITQDVMSDPVSTVDGQTYERAAIERWLARKATSPLTGLALAATTLIPNHALRKLIQENWRPQKR